MNCKYPITKAVNKGKNIPGAKNKQNAKMITGIHFIGIRHGMQQKVVCWSGFCAACAQTNIIHMGNNP